VRSELGQDVLDVTAQGAGRDVHLTGHLRGALTRHDPSQDLHLARSERAKKVLVMRCGRAPVRQARVFGAKGSSARGDHVESGQDRVDLQVLAEESGDTDFLRLCQCRRIVVGRKHHDLDVRVRAPDRPDRVETGAVGQAQLQHAGIGFVRGDGGDAVGDACRYGQYLMTMCLKHGVKSLAQKAVIVAQD